jgi:hypothetical protein
MSALGWKESSLVSGPLNENKVNHLGYFSASQVHQFDLEAAQKQFSRENEAQFKDQQEGADMYNNMQNPFYIIHALGPTKALTDSYIDYSNGNNGWGTFNLAVGVLGFSELRGFGALGKTMSIEAIWKLPARFRGTLMEYKLASTLYSGLEHLAVTVSPFFKTIDFYDPVKQLGISVKTVAASTDFRFGEIYKNIQELAEARSAGGIASSGTERTLTDVRLDIFVPKGYNTKVLKGVENAAKEAKVDLTITEIEH